MKKGGGTIQIIYTKNVYTMADIPDSTSFHESKAALHEENDDRHDEKEKVIDLFRLLVGIIILIFPFLMEILVGIIFISCR